MTVFAMKMVENTVGAPLAPEPVQFHSICNLVPNPIVIRYLGKPVLDKQN